MSDAAWFAERTEGAPGVLRSRAAEFFARSPEGDLTSRLASAGNAALIEATRDDAGRAGALDLLAADALITLALLHAAEQSPARFGAAASALRLQATAAR